MKPKDIGATVRALRTALGWTVRALALKMGRHPTGISRLESGKQDFYFGTFVRIAKALKVPAFRLYMTEKEWAKWERAR